MSDRTPKPATVRAAWCRAHPFWASTDIEEREAEFDRMIAEVERAAAEKALTEAADATLREAPGEPHAGGTFESHAVWLRARAEAYRREGGE